MTKELANVGPLKQGDGIRSRRRWEVASVCYKAFSHDREANNGCIRSGREYGLDDHGANDKVDGEWNGQWVDRFRGESF